MENRIRAQRVNLLGILLVGDLFNDETTYQNHGVIGDPRLLRALFSKAGLREHALNGRESLEK